jgi:hypothetical protein
MKMHKSETGFTPIFTLLLTVALAGVSFAGWKVYQASQATTPPASSAAPATNSQPAKTSEIPEGFIEYKNEELGFRFAYPRAWGEVEIEKGMADEGLLDPVDQARAKGTWASLRFTDQDKIIGELISRDYVPVGGKDGPCYSYLGFTDYKNKHEPWRPEAEKTDDVEIIVKAIEETSELTIVEYFEYYKNFGGPGTCPGLWFNAKTNFTENKNYPGIEIIWYQYGTKDCCQNSPNAEQLQAYKANPESAITATDRQDLLYFFESVQEL